jgi:hypothetical protein
MPPSRSSPRCSRRTSTRSSRYSGDVGELNIARVGALIATLGLVACISGCSGPSEEEGEGFLEARAADLAVVEEVMALFPPASRTLTYDGGWNRAERCLGLDYQPADWSQPQIYLYGESTDSHDGPPAEEHDRILEQALAIFERADWPRPIVADRPTGGLFEDGYRVTGEESSFSYELEFGELQFKFLVNGTCVLGHVTDLSNFGEDNPAPPPFEQVD